MIPVVLIDKNGLLVQLTMTKSDPIWKVKASFSNKSTAAMENMTLHLAAPKVTRGREMARRILIFSLSSQCN
jgi:hypothetical protein